ncbi:MAG: UDP-glucose/GDP-mannose dehydrogenase family protein [Acidobacteriota bacterium]
MKVAVIGTGYVGVVAGTCFAETGNDVICVDVDQAKIERLQKGEIPIYEPGLEEMVVRNNREGRLVFTTDLADAVRRSLIVFIAVGTPAGEDGSSDLRYVLTAAEEIARAMDGYRIIVNKSTVPVGTADRVREVVARHTRFEFNVVSNPEFLKEGAAIDDFMKPDRVIIGHDDVRVAELMKELYAPFTRTGAPILLMDNRSAEMSKYAANCMLASRISFMNEVANLCETVGADVHAVRQGIGLDRRIGPTFLFPGIGYGGSCFPKDVKALIRTGEEHGYSLDLIKTVEQVNENQKLVLVEKILRHFCPGRSAEPGVLDDRTFAVWGLSFKPRTDDMREAPSVVILERLLQLGAVIQAYDPVAVEAARRIFGDRVRFAKTNYAALDGADALLLLTEWNVFRNPDFPRILRTLKQPVIFDGRNQYNPDELTDLGFMYYCIGRPVQPGTAPTAGQGPGE